MSQSIYSLFPQLANRPQAVEPKSRRAAFTAPLAAGLFTFDVTASIGKLNHDTKAIICGIDFAANIDQLDFSDALDASFQDGFFRLDLVGGGNLHQINSAPFSFSAFGQGQNFIQEYTATGIEDLQEEFFLRLRGRLRQTLRLLETSKTSITITAQLNQFEINGGINV